MTLKGGQMSACGFLGMSLMYFQARITILNQTEGKKCMIYQFYYFGGHLGFGGHFGCFLIISGFIARSGCIRHPLKYLYMDFHILSIQTTVGTAF